MRLPSASLSCGHFVARSLVLLSLFACSSTAAHAQSPCERDVAEVQDPLDAAGYVMLALGNVWEYERYTGGFFGGVERVEVVGDTTVQDVSLFVLSRTTYAFLPEGRLSTPSASRLYRTVVDGKAMEYDATQDELTRAEVSLSSPFNACYELTSPWGHTTVVVTGAPDTTVVIGETTVAVASLKRFTEQLAQASGATDYAHGIGLVERSGGQDAITRLAYAQIGDQAWGTSPLDRYVITGTDPRDTVAAPELSLYPNPFSQSTTIRFALPEATHTRLTVLNVLGQEVDVLVDETRAAGTHDVAWEAHDHPSGVYLYRLETEGDHRTHRMLLIR